MVFILKSNFRINTITRFSFVPTAIGIGDEDAAFYYLHPVSYASVATA
jgi:hypothetical protein